MQSLQVYPSVPDGCPFVNYELRGWQGFDLIRHSDKKYSTLCKGHMSAFELMPGQTTKAMAKTGLSEGKSAKWRESGAVLLSLICCLVYPPDYSIISDLLFCHARFDVLSL